MSIFSNTNSALSLLSEKTIHGTTACYPGESFMKAIARLHHTQEAFGAVSTQHIQLCPQTLSTIDPDSAKMIAQKYPKTSFRLHANVRRGAQIELFDASCDIREDKWKSYVAHMKNVNAELGNHFWSIHAGRANVSQAQMYDNLARTQDYMKTPVGIEGLYPSKRQNWNLADFDSYAQLLKSQAYYALDLSHIQITATQQQNSQTPKTKSEQSEWEDLIVRLMEHPYCMEIHLSDNDHEEDTHKTLTVEPWWWSAFNKAQISDSCVVFTEGNQLREQHAKQRALKLHKAQANHAQKAFDFTYS